MYTPKLLTNIPKAQFEGRFIDLSNSVTDCSTVHRSPGGALGYFLGGYVPPGTPNCHPVLEKISPKIDTPF